jgi:hypothetical protein
MENNDEWWGRVLKRAKRHAMHAVKKRHTPHPLLPQRDKE